MRFGFQSYTLPSSYPSFRIGNFLNRALVTSISLWLRGLDYLMLATMPVVIKVIIIHPWFILFQDSSMLHLKWSASIIATLSTPEAYQELHPLRVFISQDARNPMQRWANSGYKLDLILPCLGALFLGVWLMEAIGCCSKLFNPRWSDCNVSKSVVPKYLCEKSRAQSWMLLATPHCHKDTGYVYIYIYIMYPSEN